MCLETGDHPGGNIRTTQDSGYTCEWGPNGYLDNVPATPALVRRLGLESDVQVADEQAALRFIYRKGKLRQVPTSPPAFLGSDALSWPGKLRILAEPIARRRPDGVDETVHDFAARRIGAEAARVLVGAMVTGVYAGDVRELSLQATFPKMHAMESDHGGLFRAMLAKRKEAKARGESDGGGPAGPGGTLTSFHGGLQRLIDALANAVGPSLRRSSPVRSISDMGRRGFRVLTAHGAPIEADAVVLACPAWHAAPLVRDMDPTMAATMDAIPSAPVAVIHLGYTISALPQPPRGFGFLVPRGEGLRILGTLFSSNIFPGRAPDGSALLTVMAGGAGDAAALDLDDSALVAMIRRELQGIMNIQVAPHFVRVFRHPRGIPQYTVGHLDRVAEIEKLCDGHGGLWVSGNSYHGISVNLCVDEAPRIAESVLAHVGLGPS